MSPALAAAITAAKALNNPVAATAIFVSSSYHEAKSIFEIRQNLNVLVPTRKYCNYISRHALSTSVLRQKIVL